MLTLVILHVYPVYPYIWLFTHVYNPSYTVYPVYPYISCLPMFTVVIKTLVYPVYMITLVILYTLYTPIYAVYSCLP